MSNYIMGASCGFQLRNKQTADKVGERGGGGTKRKRNSVEAGRRAKKGGKKL